MLAGDRSAARRKVGERGSCVLTDPAVVHDPMFLRTSHRHSDTGAIPRTAAARLMFVDDLSAMRRKIPLRSERARSTAARDAVASSL
jgi:hypothetical protein